MRNQNLTIIHHDDQETYDKCDGLVDYLKHKNLKMSYVYSNIFKLLGNNKNEISKDFLKAYSENEYHTIFDDPDPIAIKFLTDTFLQSVPKTVFALTNYGSFRISKGNKKLRACAVANVLDHHIFIISEELYGREITSEDEIYNILKNVNPIGKEFIIELHGINEPDIHVMENKETRYNWFHIDDKIKTLVNTSKLKETVKVLFCGNAKTLDPRLDVTYISNQISTMDDLLRTADMYPNFQIIVSANDPMEITFDYLTFIQCDLVSRARNRICKANNLLIFNRNDGITNQIALPPNI